MIDHDLNEPYQSGISAQHSLDELKAGTASLSYREYDHQHREIKGSLYFCHWVPTVARLVLFGPIDSLRFAVEFGGFGLRFLLNPLFP
jgi:hypothetical protein